MVNPMALVAHFVIAGPVYMETSHRGSLNIAAFLRFLCGVKTPTVFHGLGVPGKAAAPATACPALELELLII
jgi:hypothetical protein